MSDDDVNMLTIKTVLDSSGLDELERKAKSAFEAVGREADKINKSAKVTINTGEVVKSLDSAEAAARESAAAVDHLSKSVEGLSSAFNKEKSAVSSSTSNLTKKTKLLSQQADAYDDLAEASKKAAEAEQKQAQSQVDALQARLTDLNEQIKLKQSILNELTHDQDLSGDTGAARERVKYRDELNALEKEAITVSGKLGKAEVTLAKANRQVAMASGEAVRPVASLGTAIRNFGISMTHAAASSAGASPVIARNLTQLATSAGGLSVLLAGPLALGLAAAVAGLGSFVVDLIKSDDVAKDHVKTLEDLRKEYTELAQKSGDSSEHSEEFLERRQKLLEAMGDTSTKVIEDSKQAFTDIMNTELSIGQAMRDTFRAQTGDIDPWLDKIDDVKGALIGAVDAYDGSEEATKALGFAIARTAEELAGMDKGAQKLDSYKALKKIAEDLAGAFGELQSAFKVSAQMDEFTKNSLQIEENYKRTAESQREALQTAKEKAVELNKWAEGLVANTKKEEAVIQALQEKTFASLAQTVQALEEFDKKYAEDERKRTATTFTELEARYDAQLKIAEKTAANDEALAAERLAIEKTYYTALEKELRDSYAEQLKAKVELSDKQIAELKRVSDKNKEFAAQDDSLAKLEKDYANRKAIIEKTAADEKRLKQELLELDKQTNQQRLELLEKRVLSEIALTGHATDETLERIRVVREALAKIADAEAVEKGVKDTFQAVAQVLGAINNMVSSTGAFMDAMYDRRIQSLDKALERELRLIDNALEQQKALYEAQLEEYADLEKRKEKLTEEHQERLEDLNWKTQEHLTEDEYNAFMEQRAAEEEKYAESMAALEADTLARDEIAAAQEQAEAEALARKEQLEKEYAIRRAQLERKQAEMQKASALFSIAINSAAAVVQAWANPGYPLAIALTALIGALSTVQAAVVMARPLPSIPSFHKGGTIGAANADRFHYIPQADNPYDKTLFWGQRGEEVLTVEEAEHYRKMKAIGMSIKDAANRASDMNYAHMYGREVAAMGAANLHSTIDNSRVLTQTNHITAKNELTFSEANRLLERQRRRMMRRL